MFRILICRTIDGVCLDDAGDGDTGIDAGMDDRLFLMLGLGLTAFHIEDGSGLILIYNKLVFVLGMLIPVEFMPAWLRRIAL